MSQQPDHHAELMFLPAPTESLRFSLSSSAYQLTPLSEHRPIAETSDPGSSSPQSPGSHSPHSPGSLQDPPAHLSRQINAPLGLVSGEMTGEIPPAAMGSFNKPRVSLALLLEASAAAAEAEKKAEQRAHAAALTEASGGDTDKFITEAINRVHTMPRNHRNVELKPIDRRELDVLATDPSWSRIRQIERDPNLLGECRRLVRGTQGCGRECDAKFSNLVEFAKHVDAVHDVNFRPYLCPKERCPWAIIGFHERSECTRHIRTKHHKAMYSCEINGCNKIYNRSDAFRRHVRQAHANPDSRFNRLSKRAPTLHDDEDAEVDHDSGVTDDERSPLH